VAGDEEDNKKQSKLHQIQLLVYGDILLLTTSTKFTLKQLHHSGKASLI
jgi:hypothetical protein